MRLKIEEQAWNRGFWDGEAGEPLVSCPFAVGTTESWSWSSGYIEGKAFRNGFKATRPYASMAAQKKGREGAEPGAD